ncbi:MAG: hypothetical protein ACSLFK_08240 [Gemmatimonadaceae bacterium]
MRQHPRRPADGKPNGPASAVPALALLGDERYSVLVTAAGAGLSRSGAIVLSRWRNDGTRDATGQWCYLMNVGSGKVWSAGHQPVCATHLSYEAALGGDCAIIRRRDDDIETLTEIVAFPDGSGEARRVSVTNHSRAEVELELTSYQEIVLASAVSDRGHRAFGNLFVQTEWLPVAAAVLAMRRPRSAVDTAAWCGHAVAVMEGRHSTVSCETDRARFIGRGRSTRNPVAMDYPGNLSGTTGAVLDPVLALRTTLLIPAGNTASVVFTTFAAIDRDEALSLAKRYSDPGTASDAIEKALGEGDRVAREMGVGPGDTAAYHALATKLLYGTGHTPAGTRDELLTLGLTGEWPILLARLGAETDFSAATDILALHEYLRRKGVEVDLVFICGNAGLVERVIDEAMPPGDETRDAGVLDQQRVFVRNEHAIGQAAVALLESLARVSVDCASDWRTG